MIRKGRFANHHAQRFYPSSNWGTVFEGEYGRMDVWTLPRVKLSGLGGTPYRLIILPAVTQLPRKASVGEYKS